MEKLSVSWFNLVAIFQTQIFTDGTNIDPCSNYQFIKELYFACGFNWTLIKEPIYLTMLQNVKPYQVLSGIFF